MPCMKKAADHAWKLWCMQQTALPYDTAANSCLEAAAAPCPAVSAADGIHALPWPLATLAVPLAMLAVPLAMLVPLVMLCPCAVCFPWTARFRAVDLADIFF